MAQIPVDAHWRDSARPVKFFMLDGKACFPLLLFIMHIRLWTLIVAIIAMLFFGILNHYGFSVTVFTRWLRNFAAGTRRLATPWWMD